MPNFQNDLTSIEFEGRMTQCGGLRPLIRKDVILHGTRKRSKVALIFIAAEMERSVSSLARLYRAVVICGINE